jgi:hypothetical protein
LYGLNPLLMLALQNLPAIPLAGSWTHTSYHTCQEAILGQAPSACLQKFAYLFEALLASTRRGCTGAGEGPRGGDREKMRRKGAFSTARGAKPLWKCLVATGTICREFMQRGTSGAGRTQAAHLPIILLVLLDFRSKRGNLWVYLDMAGAGHSPTGNSCYAALRRVASEEFQGLGHTTITSGTGTPSADTASKTRSEV